MGAEGKGGTKRLNGFYVMFFVVGVKEIL